MMLMIIYKLNTIGDFHTYVDDSQLCFIFLPKLFLKSLTFLML